MKAKLIIVNTGLFCIAYTGGMDRLFAARNDISLAIGWLSAAFVVWVLDGQAFLRLCKRVNIVAFRITLFFAVVLGLLLLTCATSLFADLILRVFQF